MNHSSSRSESDLAPELVAAWHLMKAEFNRLHPSLPQPFLTQTYRSPVDQDATYAMGRTVPGKIVTNAKAGQSLHNYYPSYAFDVAFKDAHGNVAWDNNLFQLLGQVGLSVGIGWGGAWHSFKDYPHFEPPHFTWEQAKAGQRPAYPDGLQAMISTEPQGGIN